METLVSNKVFVDRLLTLVLIEKTKSVKKQYKMWVCSEIIWSDQNFRWAIIYFWDAIIIWNTKKEDSLIIFLKSSPILSKIVFWSFVFDYQQMNKWNITKNLYPKRMLAKETLLWIFRFKTYWVKNIFDLNNITVDFFWKHISRSRIK